jgi:hypothetical protein
MISPIHLSRLDDYKALKFAIRSRRAARREAVREHSFNAFTTTSMMAPFVSSGRAAAAWLPVPARILLSVPRVPLAFPLRRGCSLPRGAESTEYILDIADALLLEEEWDSARVVVLDSLRLGELAKTDPRYSAGVATAAAAAAAASSASGVASSVGCATPRASTSALDLDDDEQIIRVRSPRSLRRPRSSTSGRNTAGNFSPFRTVARPVSAELPAPRFRDLGSSVTGTYDAARTASFRAAYEAGEGGASKRGSHKSSGGAVGGKWLMRPRPFIDSYARYARMLPLSISVPLLRFISEKHYEDGYSVEDAWLAGITADAPLAGDIEFDPDIPISGVDGVDDTDFDGRAGQARAALSSSASASGDKLPGAWRGRGTHEMGLAAAKSVENRALAGTGATTAHGTSTPRRPHVQAYAGGDIKNEFVFTDWRPRSPSPASSPADSAFRNSLHRTRQSAGAAAASSSALVVSALGNVAILPEKSLKKKVPSSAQPLVSTAITGHPKNAVLKLKPQKKPVPQPSAPKASKLSHLNTKAVVALNRRVLPPVQNPEQQPTPRAKSFFDVFGSIGSLVGSWGKQAAFSSVAVDDASSNTASRLERAVKRAKLAP